MCPAKYRLRGANKGECKMRLLSTVCVASLGIGLVLPAFAADMPVKAPLKAPPLVALSWTGCYLGGNVGGGWADKHYTDPLALPPAFDLGSHTAEGVIGGGQVGCDYQAGPWVFGAQGKFDWANLQASHLALGDFYETRIRSYETATGRIGYAFQSNFLLYVKGGGAWISEREIKTDLATGLVEGLAKVNRSGWTVGGGAEYLFAPNWSVFAEVNYMDFGTRRTNFTNLEVPPIPPTFPLDIRQRVTAVMAGINFRFSGLGPLAASY